MIMHLREVAQIVGNVQNTDTADFRKALTFGKEVWFNTWHVNGHVDNDTIKANLLTNRFLDPKILESARAFTVWVHGPWPFLESYLLQERINEVCKDADRSVQPYWGEHKTADNKHVSLLVVGDTTSSAEAAERKRTQRYADARRRSLKCSVNGQSVTLVLPSELVDEWDLEIKKESANIGRLNELRATMAGEEQQGRAPDIPQRIVQGSRPHNPPFFNLILYTMIHAFGDIIQFKDDRLGSMQLDYQRRPTVK